MYALITNGAVSRYPYAITDLRRDNPQVSFSIEPADASLAECGAARVYFSTQPSFDSSTQALDELTPVYAADNARWEQVWSIRPLSGDELAQKRQQIQGQIVEATQARLDDFAKTRNYDGILSAATYAASSSAQFSKEGHCAVQARDATWSALYAILADVQAGTRPMPAGYADIEPELPALAWAA